MTKAKAPRAGDGGGAVDTLLGDSPVMTRLRALLAEVGASGARVLLGGESGTGKELAARAIHRASPRAKLPFVTVTCGAIPDALIESELFGYKKGAFTGAVTDRRGRVEAAAGGTLFLDEVGDLSLGAQAKVLRMIQEGRMEPLGGEESVAVDVRIISSSNKNLAASAAAGRFREDLFYRLNVIPITLPPLRERKGDAPVLFRAFLAEVAAAAGAAMSLTPEGAAFLESYAWPGNVRELRNLAERCAARFPPGQALGEGELRALLLDEAPSSVPIERKRILDLRNALEAGYNEARELFERQYLRYQFDKAGGNVAKAAAAAGLGTTALRGKLQKYKIQ